MKFEKHCGLAYKHLAHSELFCLPVIDNSNQLKQSKKMYFNKGLSQASKDKVQLCLKKDLAWRTRDSRSLEVPHPQALGVSPGLFAHFYLLSEQSYLL